jgi:type IV pilus assembly protein PilA
MLSSLKLQDEKREEGFTLIELLVVVIIIGILAAIAIPVFLNQRQNAWRSAVESDLRNAAIQMETAYTRNGIYPNAFTDVTGTFELQSGTPAEDTGVEIQLTRNVSMSHEVVDQESYILTGTHSQLPEDENTLTFSSAAGGLQSTWTAGAAAEDE